MNSDGLFVYIITSYDSIYYLSNWYNNEDYSIRTSNNLIKLWQSITCSSSGQYVYAVAKNDKVYISSNYGSTWTTSFNKKMMWSYISTSSSGQYVYSLVNGEYIYHSTDYGNNWSISNPSYALWSFVTVANNIVYTLDSLGNIYQSNVTSYVWDKVNSYKIQDAIVCVSYDNNYVYVLAPSIPIYSLHQFLPTVSPTNIPTNLPIKPLSLPSDHPTLNPTGITTISPTYYPINFQSFEPSYYPNDQPSISPTSHPTIKPSNDPTVQPTNYPTIYPTNQPTDSPTTYPTDQPTISPSSHPTIKPSNDPTVQPTNYPTIYPTNQPTDSPTTYPTDQPTISPSSNSPTIHPSSANSIPYSISTESLVAFADFADSRCYSGSGSSYTNIIDSSSQYFYGTYSQNSDKSIRLVNTASCSIPASGIHLSNYNTYTVSMWIRRESTQTLCTYTYLIDGRSGFPDSFIYSAAVGDSWKYMSLNGGAYTTPSSSISTIFPLSTWTYLTLVTNEAQANAVIFFASRYTQTEGFDCSIKSIYVYSTFINQTTNYANYLVSSSFVLPTNTPTSSPSINL